MPYRVDLTERAIRDLAYLYEIKNAAESLAAARWYNGLERAVFTLETHPRPCPLAPESKKTARPLRHLLYGKSPHVYRVIYEIDEVRKLVQVLTIRHGAKEPADFEA
jgi:toxin ParE1/3/4